MARIARLTRRRLIPAFVVALALVMTGCAAGQVAQTASQKAAIDGGNATVGPIGVRDVRFAPTLGNSYDAGSDVPVKLWISNESAAVDTLSSVTTPGAAAAKIDGNAELPAQTLVEITDSTPITVTLTGLTAALPYGHSIPVTFSFANAGSLTVNVPIEVPGDRGPETRDTVNLLPAEPSSVWFGGEAPR